MNRIGKIKTITHIDLDCNLVTDRNGELILLVSENYYNDFEQKINKICIITKSRLFIVPQREAENRLINSISLPFGEILIPNNCPISKKFLIANLGKNNIFEVTIDDHFSYNFGMGGLACMSSLIYHYK